MYTSLPYEKKKYSMSNFCTTLILSYTTSLVLDFWYFYYCMLHFIVLKQTASKVCYSSQLFLLSLHVENVTQKPQERMDLPGNLLRLVHSTLAVFTSSSIAVIRFLSSSISFWRALPSSTFVFSSPFSFRRQSTRAFKLSNPGAWEALGYVLGESRAPRPRRD